MVFSQGSDVLQNFTGRHDHGQGVQAHVVGERHHLLLRLTSADGHGDTLDAACSNRLSAATAIKTINKVCCSIVFTRSAEPGALTL